MYQWVTQLHEVPRRLRQLVAGQLQWEDLVLFVALVVVEPLLQTLYPVERMLWWPISYRVGLYVLLVIMPVLAVLLTTPLGHVLQQRYYAAGFILMLFAMQFVSMRVHLFAFILFFALFLPTLLYKRRQYEQQREWQLPPVWRRVLVLPLTIFFSALANYAIGRGPDYVFSLGMQYYISPRIPLWDAWQWPSLFFTIAICFTLFVLAPRWMVQINKVNPWAWVLRFFLFGVATILQLMQHATRG